MKFSLNSFIFKIKLKTNIFANNKYLLKIYNDIDKTISKFSKKYSISCPENCGICCENFEPIITNLEAELIAYYIIFYKKELISKFANINSRVNCIFFDHSNSKHCLIYPVRSLLCRSFGFTGFINKKMEIIYKTCKHMPQSFEIEKTKDIPVMSYFGTRLSTHSFEGNNSQLPISVAVYNSYKKIEMLKNLSKKKE